MPGPAAAAPTLAEQMPDLFPVGSFTFDAAEYEATSGAAMTRLEQLARRERDTEAAWRGERMLRARLGRVLTSTTRRRGQVPPRQR